MLHPLQVAFIEHDGFQCGFCTPGQIMSGVAVIEEAKAGWPSAATADVTKPFTIPDLSNAEIRERMSGNLCRCACYPNIVDAVADAAGEELNHASASRSRGADDPAQGNSRPCSGSPTRLYCGRHRSPRADEGPRSASRATAGHQPSCRHGADRGASEWWSADRRARPHERRGGASDVRRTLSGCRRRRCCSPHPANCATWRRSAATSCSARVAPISATKMASLATSGALAPAARPSTASIAITRSSDGPTPVSPRILPILPWHWPPWTPTSLCSGRRESDRSRSRSSIACLAARRSETPSLDRGDLIVAIDVPGQPRGPRLPLPQGPRSRILRVRACVRGGCGRDRRAAPPLGAARYGRRRAQALAARSSRNGTAQHFVGRR